MRHLCLLLLVAALLPACRILPGSRAYKANQIKRAVIKSPVFRQSFTGFHLGDPTTGKTLADFQGNRYFIPGSNTKLLTLAACLEVLGDSIPGLQYAIMPPQDTLVRTLIRGTGDPTFLHPDFAAWQPVYTWLQQQNPYKTWMKWTVVPRFGAGWAWDDFNEWYSPELIYFPLYGNVVTIRKQQGKWEFRPFLRFKSIYFPKSYTPDVSPKIIRNEKWRSYQATQPDTSFYEGYTQQIPLTFAGVNGPIFDELLRDTFHRTPFVIDEFEQVNTRPRWTNLYAAPTDTVLRRMMHQSDNFFAEQLLLLCAQQKFDTLWQEPLKHWVVDSLLPGLPQRPKWADGSGLSRYNLMTPQSAVHILTHLWQTEPKERLFNLLPAGGRNGTIANLYAGRDGKPYVFAKSGSMGSVYCISGYVVCKSGKVLTFSFMHNNFYSPNQPWKSQIQQILELIHDTF